jgi:hypothetical protein
MIGMHNNKGFREYAMSPDQLKEREGLVPGINMTGVGKNGPENLIG